MTTSTEVKDLFAAIALAQGEFAAAQKDKQNPFFKSSYADISSVLTAIRPSLAKHGVAVMQPLSSSGENHFISTMITHSSGQFITLDPVLMVIKDKTDPQKFKSAVTYYRRTCLLSALGIEETDDDGNEASQDNHPPRGVPSNDEPPKPANHAPGSAGTALSEAQIKRFWAMTARLGWSKEASFQSLKKHFKAEKPEDMTLPQYKEITGWMDEQIKNQPSQ